MEKSEIVNLLNSNDEGLFRRADEIRKKYKGDEIHLRGLVEFTNICKRNCAYCGLQARNKKIERYRLCEKEIVSLAECGVELGYKTIVLQGGEDDFYTKEKLCNIIKEIKKFDVAVTLSVGERSEEDYEAFKNAGCDRYLLRIETTDKALYQRLHPKMDFENRVNCLYNLKKLGYETGTGSLVGLPGQSVESLADDILFFKELNADMVGIGPFIPHPNTPLKGDINPKNFDLALKMMSLTRIILPDINIPATTAMETINPNGRLIALQAGANVVMPNITSSEFCPKYEIYPGKPKPENSIEKGLLELQRKLKSINRTVSKSKGFRYD